MKLIVDVEELVELRIIYVPKRFNFINHKK
jgi:hypothetical protein